MKVKMSIFVVYSHGHVKITIEMSTKIQEYVAL